MAGNYNEVAVEIDIEQLDERVKDKLEADLPSSRQVEVRSTVFSLGEDPRVSSEQPPAPPEVRFVEILKDGLDNPYVEVNWRMARSEVDNNNIIGFKIWKRKVSRDKFLRDNRTEETSERNFSRVAFDKLSRGITKRGNFSSDRKAINQIKSDLIPDSIKNPKLEQYRESSKARAIPSLQPTSPFAKNRVLASRVDKVNVFNTRPDFERVFDEVKFKQVGYVGYDQFLKKEKSKFVQVIEREFVDLSFKDVAVGYGEIFEYYITPVSKKIKTTPKSDTVSVMVEDQTPISPPTQLLAKQSSENEISLTICIDPRDNVSRAIIFRRSDRQVTFQKIASVQNVDDCIKIIDSTVSYGETYTYRVFLENIYGSISDPKDLISGGGQAAGEITITSTTQRVTPQTRSNNLRVPVVEVLPDQNSDFVKLIISPNDPLVSFYEIERRNLTTKEKKFSVPSRLTGYGGVGWESNRIFVKKERGLVDNTVSQERDVLNKSLSGNEIVFLDATVTPGHIYQYRVKGCDLFCNSSPHSLKIVRATGKKILRSPINFKSELLRANPFRIKISWNDDNLQVENTLEKAFSKETSLNPIEPDLVYIVQRRRQGEMKYESFPATANRFIIDEVPSLDAVPFNSSEQEDTFGKLPDKQRDDGTVRLSREQQPIRPFGAPNYLSENEVYFYRVYSRDRFGNISNPTEEFKVSTLPSLADPENLKVKVFNTKVRPLIAYVTWSVDPTKYRPDYWIVERKFDNENDTFELIGRSYLEPRFVDKDVDVNSNYIYRVRSVDTQGRTSSFFEVRLTT